MGRLIPVPAPLVVFLFLAFKPVVLQLAPALKLTPFRYPMDTRGFSSKDLVGRPKRGDLKLWGGLSCMYTSLLTKPFQASFSSSLPLVPHFPGPLTVWPKQVASILGTNFLHPRYSNNGHILGFGVYHMVNHSLKAFNFPQGHYILFDAVLAFSQNNYFTIFKIQLHSHIIVLFIYCNTWRFWVNEV